MTTTLVTGSTRGIGLEFVRQLAARGHNVIASARNPASTPELAQLTKTLAALDVADPVSLKSFVADLAGTPIDILINNAGVSNEDKRVGALSLDAFQKTFATNAFGPALLTQSLLANLLKGQRKLIINITSQLGSITNTRPGFSYAYCASKTALNQLTSLMAHELKPQGLTVVAVCPGWNRTDMGGSAAPLDPKDSVRQMLDLFDRLTPADSGTYRRIDGSTIPW